MFCGSQAARAVPVSGAWAGLPQQRLYLRGLPQGHGALRPTFWTDLHGGFESYGGRGLLVTQNVSKSVECEVGEATEFV